MTKKQILSDPVAAYLASGHEAETINTALNQLSLNAIAIKQQIKNTRTQSQILSRKIGEARRNGEPFEELKRSMHEHSVQLKLLNNQLRDVENRILDIFEAETTAPLNDTPSTISAYSESDEPRTYRQNIENPDTISISLLNDEHDQWNSYVSKNPAATIHHRTEWRELLEQSYGLESFYFIAHDANGNVVGILPLVRLKSRLFGDFLVSMPWFARGGAVADAPLIEHRLMHMANKHASTLGIEHIEYRDDIEHEGYPVLKHKVNMVLSLPDSEEELWSGFTSKLRAQIRRPQREKTEILIGGEELVNEFYKVYTCNMRDLGSPAHGKPFIINMLQHFPQNCWIIVLRLNNQPVAAGLLLGMSDTLEIPLASTIRSVNSLSMNMLLYWHVLKFAIENGYKNFDFGRSSLDAGTYRFKKQWGAIPKQLYWHYWLGESAELPSLNPANPKYALVINLWKRLPLALANWIGPLIVKHLP